MSAPTIKTKVANMKRDLATLVTKMNQDRSYKAATLAQEALVAVNTLEDELESMFGDNLGEMPWSWRPEKT